MVYKTCCPSVDHAMNSWTCFALRHWRYCGVFLLCGVNAIVSNVSWKWGRLRNYNQDWTYIGCALCLRQLNDFMLCQIYVPNLMGRNQWLRSNVALSFAIAFMSVAWSVLTYFQMTSISIERDKIQMRSKPPLHVFEIMVWHKKGFTGAAWSNRTSLTCWTCSCLDCTCAYYFESIIQFHVHRAALACTCLMYILIWRFLCCRFFVFVEWTHTTTFSTSVAALPYWICENIFLAANSYT